jgi:hypothetical protein
MIPQQMVAERNKSNQKIKYFAFERSLANPADDIEA